MADEAAGFNPDDFRRLRPAEDTHFWFISRNDVLAAALATISVDASTTPVLEIGCGTGNTLRALRESLPGATVVGMDAFHEGLLYARGRTDAWLVEGRIEHAPFRTSFPLIGMFDVLEHLEDDAEALRSIRQMLSPGGYLMLTVPAGPSLWSRYDEESHHFRRYTEAHLRSVLTTAGFQIEYLSHFMSVTYPAVWLSRRLERRQASRSDRATRVPVIERELRVPFLVNLLFRTLLRIEAPAIRRRYHLPFGSSLLVVARP